MEEKLKEFLREGNYLPPIIQDFDDQKILFRRLGEITANRNDPYTKDLSWVSAQVYTIDIFLWFMAKHGYTLQKSRKHIPFESLEEELSHFDEQAREGIAQLIRGLMQPKNPLPETDSINNA